MSCPYFRPAVRLDERAWAVPPRLPLGDAYAGECMADAVPRTPDDAIMRTACNTGYGRGRCECFPADARADAVRFHLADDSGGVLRIQYIFEKDCWPVEHGCLCYSQDSVASAEAGDSAGSMLLRSQAAAFAESYLRRAHNQ